MSRTLIAIEGRFENPDGSVASGTVTSVPDSQVSNGGIEYPESPIEGVLNCLGQIVAQSMYALEVGASDDTGTTPLDSSYTFTIKLDGAPIQEFSAPVPAASTATETDGTTTINSPTVILSDLVVAQSMVDKPITGTNIPVNTTVLSISLITNTLTLSANATASTLGSCSFVIGGAVMIATLIAAAL